MNLRKRIAYLLEKYEENHVATNRISGTQMFLDDYQDIMMPSPHLCV